MDRSPVWARRDPAASRTQAFSRPSGRPPGRQRCGSWDPLLPSDLTQHAADEEAVRPFHCRMNLA